MRFQLYTHAIYFQAVLLYITLMRRQLCYLLIHILHDNTSYCNNCLKDQCDARVPMCNTVGSEGLTLWDVTIFLVSWFSSKKTLTDLSSLTIMHRLCCRLSSSWMSLLSFGCDTFFWCLFFSTSQFQRWHCSFFSPKAWKLTVCLHVAQDSLHLSICPLEIYNLLFVLLSFFF